MLKKYALIALVALSVACGGSTVTGPTPESNTPAPVAQEAPPPPVANPPSAAPNDQTPTWEGYIKANAGFFVKNTSGTVSKFTAYTTSFDNQDLPLAQKSATIQNGDFFEDSFNTTCVQVDITYGAAGDAPFLFGYIDELGAVVKTITAATRLACAPKKPPCVEPEPVAQIPGAFDWGVLTAGQENIYEGQCNPEVLPLPIPSVSGATTTTLNCHTNGSQRITNDFVCSNDTTTTRNLCKNVACPCTYPSATYSNTVFVEEDRDSSSWRSDWYVRAKAHVQGAATWKLEIYAASRTSEYDGNEPDYTKVSVERVLTCDQTFNFDIEYHSEGHGSDVWWAALYKNGIRVWKSQVEYN